MSDKIKAHHLTRKAVLYIRQSSPGQVLQNQESQRLQYAMEQRLRQLGWTGAIVNCCVPRKTESGGVLQYSVGKDPTLDKEGQLLMSVEPAPSLLSGLGQFEHHRQARLPRTVSFRAAVA